MIDHDLYIFVVDTDRYSGNFAQELCAHMTGMPPTTCGFGRTDAYAKAYRDEMGIQGDEEYNDHIIHIDDERGQCSVWPAPGSKYPAYHSVAIFMDRRPTDDEVQVMLDRARKFVLKGDPSETPTIEGFRLLLRTVNEQPLMSWPSKENTNDRLLRQGRVEANLRIALEELAFACPFSNIDSVVSEGLHEFEIAVDDAKDLFRPMREGGTWDSELQKLVDACEVFDPIAHNCNDGYLPDEVEAECWEPYREALREAKALLGDLPD